MQIPSYQMYNVLKNYCEWVRNNRASSMEKFNGRDPEYDRPVIPPDRHRQSIMEKVGKNIVSKITSLESGSKKSPGVAEALKTYEVKNGLPAERNEDRFIFNTIKNGCGKTTHTLLIDKSSFLAIRKKCSPGNADVSIPEKQIGLHEDLKME